MFYKQIYAVLLTILLTCSPLPVKNSQAATFNLTAKSECGYIMLSWDKVPDAVRYYVYRGPGKGLEYNMPLTDFPITDTFYKDTNGLMMNQRYYYIVKAVNKNSQEYSTSQEASATFTCNEEIPATPNTNSGDCKMLLKYQVGNLFYWNNEVKKGPMDTAPEIRYARVNLMARYLAEEMGASVSWESSSSRIDIKMLDGSVIEMQIGSSLSKINGVSTPIDPNNPLVVPYISSNRTYVPLRFISFNLGAKGDSDIVWNGDTRTAELNFKDPTCNGVCGVILAYTTDDIDPNKINIQFKPQGTSNIQNLVIPASLVANNACSYKSNPNNCLAPNSLPWVLQTYIEYNPYGTNNRPTDTDPERQWNVKIWKDISGPNRIVKWEMWPQEECKSCDPVSLGCILEIEDLSIPESGIRKWKAIFDPDCNSATNNPDIRYITSNQEHEILKSILQKCLEKPAVDGNDCCISACLDNGIISNISSNFGVGPCNPTGKGRIYGTVSGAYNPVKIKIEGIGSTTYLGYFEVNTTNGEYETSHSDLSNCSLACPGKYRVTPERVPGITFSPPYRDINMVKCCIDSTSYQSNFEGKPDTKAQFLATFEDSCKGCMDTTTVYVTRTQDGSSVISGKPIWSEQNNQYEFDTGCKLDCPGQYTITPLSSSGCSFVIPSWKVEFSKEKDNCCDISAHEEYQFECNPTPDKGRITGTIHGNGGETLITIVKVSAQKEKEFTFTADANGSFDSGCLFQCGVSYTVTPAKEGYIFSPLSVEVTINKCCPNGSETVSFECIENLSCPPGFEKVRFTESFPQPRESILGMVFCKWCPGKTKMSNPIGIYGISDIPYHLVRNSDNREKHLQGEHSTKNHISLTNPKLTVNLKSV